MTTQAIRRIAAHLDHLAIVGIAAMVVLGMLAGCARMASTLGAAPATPARCAQLDDRAILWGGIGGASAALAGASGLSTVATDDRALRTSLAVSSVVMGAVAAGAAYVSRSSSERWASEGCGR